jgi:hypothetical protein
MIVFGVTFAAVAGDDAVAPIPAGTALTAEPLIAYAFAVVTDGVHNATSSLYVVPGQTSAMFCCH